MAEGVVFVPSGIDIDSDVIYQHGRAVTYVIGRVEARGEFVAGSARISARVPLDTDEIRAVEAIIEAAAERQRLRFASLFAGDVQA